MNCSWFGDYPEEFDFCLRECPVKVREACAALQCKRYPLECWRVVAARYKREVRVEEAQKK